MHVDIAKALEEALGNLDGVTDDIVHQRLKPRAAPADGAPVGVEVAKVEVAPDGEEVSPQEEEITGDLLEKLKALLAGE